MTTVTEDRPSTVANERQLHYSALAVVAATLGVFWPGGRVLLADLFFTLTVLAVITAAVTRHPGFRELIEAAPSAAKWGAKAFLGAFLIGQLWGVSAQTFPIASWTMYSQNPGPEAVVFRFDAVTAAGESVAFTPSASNRTVPAKMGLVHLRRLSERVYQSSIGSDADQLAIDKDTLTRAITTYVEFHNANASLSDSPPVSVAVSRVTYDITQEDLSVASGERTVLMQIDLEAP